MTGPPGPCGCGCALTPATSAGFGAVDFANDPLGIQPIPWQRWLLIHAHELRPDGRFRFRTVLVLVARQNGKALDCDVPILTANRGWATMNDLVVGDFVYHPAGHPVRVTFTSDVMTGHDCYRVTTTDGRSVIADADHLWTVTDKRRSTSRGRRNEAKVRTFETRDLTTSELLAEGLSRYSEGSRTSATGGKMYSTNEYRFMLPTQEPLKSPEVSLPLDPYLLGAWLGDGHSADARLTCHPDDAAHWCDAIVAAGFIPVERAVRATRQIGITCAEGVGRQKRSMGGHLRRLGVLGRKHVPDLYLVAGMQQREALLQGLMDTDGSVSRAGQVEFCSANEQLARDVLFLARSLGWRATLREGRATIAGRDCGPKYRVSWTPTQSDPFAPFRLARKAARVKPVDGGKGRSTVSIARIEPVESMPVRCIKVDSPDGLFLAGRDLVATHNTTIVEVKNLWKMFVLGVGLVLGTAQNLDYSEESWSNAVDLVESIPELAAEVVHVDKTNGKKALRLSNGSRWKVAAASRKGGRSLSAEDVNLDELREHQTWDSWGAVTKTTIARKKAQIWAFTNAGDDKSVVLNDLMEKGRAAVESGGDGSFGHFEWSAPDEIKCTCGRPGKRHTVDCLLQDRAAWAMANPSLGYTVTEDALADALDTDPVNVFRTECLCQKVDKLLPEWAVIGKDAWERVADPDSELVDPVAFALDVTPDRSRGSIGAAGRRPDGLDHVEVIDNRPGTSWMVPRMVELVDRWGPVAVVVDPGGPAGSLIPELEAAGITVVKPTSREYAQACGSFYDAIVPPKDAPEDWEPTLRHRGQPVLTAAIAGAAKRVLSDLWAWARQSESVDLSPVPAVTLARWGHATRAHLVKEEIEPWSAWV